MPQLDGKEVTHIKRERDAEWTVAFAIAFGVHSGIQAPLTPDPKQIRKCLEEIVKRGLELN
jgi:hypothetical protein